MTSNIGSQFLLEGDTEENRNKVLDSLKIHFKPEFLNRVDDVVLFHALSQKHIANILDIQLDILASRLKTRELSLDISKGAKDKLAELGYDPIYGARPLKRVIQKELTNNISKSLLENKYQPGENIDVGLDDSGCIQI